MGAWPLPTGDSLVVPSRAQVNLLGPCDRSFQTTPLTMSSAARPIARETPSPGAARRVGMGACNRPRVLQSCRSTPVNVMAHGKPAGAGAFPLYPFIYFPIRRTGPS
jgi:hypothetical protein